MRTKLGVETEDILSGPCFFTGLVSGVKTGLEKVVSKVMVKHCISEGPHKCRNTGACVDLRKSYYNLLLFCVKL